MLAPAVLADADLEAYGMQITNSGNQDQVDWSAGVHLDEQTADFGFTVTLEQWRNGQLIDSLSESFSSDITNSVLCDESCHVKLCGASCLIVYNGVISAFGTCRDRRPCDGKPGFKVCGCSHNVSGGKLFVLTTGDILRMTLTPDASTTDPDPSNNVIELTAP